MPSFAEGSLFLVNEKEQYLRLAWERADEGAVHADRRRAAPAGRYRVVGYRIIRQDAEDREWMLSATGPKIQNLLIEAGKETAIDLDDRVHMQCRVRRNGPMVQIQASIHGANHSGLSIYCQGKRIPMGYEVRQEGEAVTQGRMAYG